MTLSEYMNRLKRTQELPEQQLTPTQTYDPQKIAGDVQAAKTGLQMPQVGGQFNQPVGAERMALTDTNLSGPMKDVPAASKDGVPFGVTKAAVDAVGGTLQAIAQSQYLSEEGRKQSEAEAKQREARSIAKTQRQTGAQQFSGLSGLMDVYRGVYGGRKR